MNKKMIVIFVAILLSLAILSGCNGESSEPEVFSSGGSSVSGVQFNEVAAGSNLPLVVQLENEENSILVHINGNVSQGQLSLRLNDAGGEAILDMPVGQGEFELQHLLENLPAGEYQLGIAWDGPVEGTYNLSWEHQ